MKMKHFQLRTAIPTILSILMIYVPLVAAAITEKSSGGSSSTSTVQAIPSEYMSKSGLVDAFEGMEEGVTPIQLTLTNSKVVEALFLRYDDLAERVWFRFEKDQRAFPDKSVPLKDVKRVSRLSSPEHPSAWSLKHPKKGRSTTWLKSFLDAIGSGFAHN